MQQTPEYGPAVGPQVLFAFDGEGVCTLSTGPGLEQLGLLPGDLVGRNLFEVYGDDEAGVAALQRVLGGETLTQEREFAGRILAIYYEPTFDPDGRVTGALGVTTDVTEQRRIEREVRWARQRATLLADTSDALSRETPDSEALADLVVRSVTEPVADTGTLWLRTDQGARLVLTARWSRTDDDPATGRAPDLSAVKALDGVRRLPCGPGEPARLQVPLRSRGLLLGVIDVERAAGDFTDAEVDLVGEIAGRCALSLDNAHLLDAQREAHEQLVKFQALANASENLIAISDPADRLIYTNPRVRNFGIDTAGLDVWSAATRYLGETTTRAIRDCVTGSGGRWSGEGEIALPDGIRIGQIDAFRLAHPETGAVLGIGWIAKDMTDLHSTEAALRLANADLLQFKALVDTSPDFIAIADLDGTVRYVNPAGRLIVGLGPDVDVTTTTIPDYLTPEGLQASLEVEQPAVVEHGHWEGESTLRSRSGAAIPVAIASFLMRDAETGEPFALATVQRDISQRLAAETALRDLADQRQALLSRLVDAQDAERARIAADVHDDPVQALAAVDLRLGMLHRRMLEDAPDLVDLVRPLQASVSGATERLRALLFDLEPPDLRHGLAGALHRAAEEIFEGTGTQWVVDGDEEPAVPDTVRAIAYRITKEAFNNVRRHASADHVAAAVTGRDGGIEVTVADDGVGLGPDPLRWVPGHRGLVTMRDTAAIAGGWCSVGETDRGGTLVTTWLPGTSIVAARPNAGQDAS